MTDNHMCTCAYYYTILYYTIYYTTATYIQIMMMMMPTLQNKMIVFDLLHHDLQSLHARNLCRNRREQVVAHDEVLELGQRGDLHR